MHIRRYEPCDKRAVRRLHDDALNEVGAHLGSGPWDDDLDEIESVYLDSGGEFLVGVLNGEIVAMGALMRVSTEKAELKRMRVRPGLQGRGYGQAMLDALHRRAAGSATLRCASTRPCSSGRPRRLYLKNGYREAGRGSHRTFRLHLLRERRSLPEKGSYEAAGVSIERGEQAVRPHALRRRENPRPRSPRRAPVASPAFTPSPATETPSSPRPSMASARRSSSPERWDATTL